MRIFSLGTHVTGYMVVNQFRWNESEGTYDLLVTQRMGSSASKMYYVQFDANDLMTKQNEKRIAPALASHLNTDVAVNTSATFLGDQGIIYASDEDTLFQTLRYYDFKTDRHFSVLLDDSLGATVTASGTRGAAIPWNVERICVGETDIIVSYNEHGVSTFYHCLRDNLLHAVAAYGARGSHVMAVPGYISDDGGSGSAEAQQPVSSPSAKRNVTIGLSKLNWDVRIGRGVVRGECCFAEQAVNKRCFGFSVITASGPSDCFIADFSVVGPNSVGAMPVMTRWTRSEVGGLDTSKFVEPELIKYPSFDQLEISAFLYNPPRPVDGSKVPVIIHPHGGPEGQHRPTFASFKQYLMLEEGVAIIDPNIRGSSGYGKVFVTLDDCEKREDSVKDIGALIHWIESVGARDFNLDPKRIAVWGGSYGGYMTLATLINYNTKIRCGIDNVGISNFVTFLQNTSAYRRDLRRLKYGDERKPEMRAFLQRISPSNNANKIVAPLFVVQGANDPRVPLSEAEQIYLTARNNGQDVWYMVADNEGHGFKKKVNIDAYEEAQVQFWRRFLLNR